MRPSYPIYLAGSFVSTEKPLPIINPYTGAQWTTAYLADKGHLEQAIQKALSVQDELKHLPTYAKAEALNSIAQGIKNRKEEFAQAMTRETAKPLIYSRGEVDRAMATFTDAAEECKRIEGVWMALDRIPGTAGHEAVVRRFPIGPIAAISPFNFPLNLVAHKIAPAIAAGCPIILKPASKTPIVALMLAELIDATALPKGAVSILPMDRETGDMLVTDERFKLLTFTGSPTVGWDMKTRAGKKKVVLELGGNAGCIIAESANLESALKKSVIGSFSFSGQSCIHTQRIFVHISMFEMFKNRFVTETHLLKYGDPLDESTQISSMIDAGNAERIETWVKEAIAGGARLLCGGTRIGETGYAPTVLTNTKKEMKICAMEAFAPIVVLEPYYDFKDAIARINDSQFGLQAGIFTNKMDEIFYAYDALDVGGVIINNVPTFRADNMPYGGVKDSGLGREGVRYAMEDMTELKTLVFNKLT